MNEWGRVCRGALCPKHASFENWFLKEAGIRATFMWPKQNGLFEYGQHPGHFDRAARMEVRTSLADFRPKSQEHLAFQQGSGKSTRSQAEPGNENSVSL